MEVSINANMCDEATTRIAETLRSAFKTISKDLSQDYGGTIKHLWIDFELIQRHAERRSPFPFRFQKRVGGSISKLIGLPMPVYENVGHYSVRPDFQELLRIPLESVARYALSLIYASTSVLVAKQKKLGGFDAERFRLDFLSSCKEHGFEIIHTIVLKPGRLVRN
ncbi:MAG TPA: hypothetical protein VN048_16020 [Verrucomicrobiae bacterium]|jgi:hypothetical protein|nr:hypothetical protein [Verrucomicrobiae bacterium]